MAATEGRRGLNRNEEERGRGEESEKDIKEIEGITARNGDQGGARCRKRKLKKPQKHCHKQEQRTSEEGRVYDYTSKIWFVKYVFERGLSNRLTA